MTVLATNINARNYQITDRFEAGVALLGCEVKSTRSGQISLKESFAKIRNGEAWLMNAHVAPYPFGTPAGYEPTRTRKLLLKKSELKSLIGKLQEQGLSLIPVNAHLKHNRIKIELGLGKGLKKYDKRAAIKQKEFKRLQQRVKHSRG
ncbi:SsrA-binding protein SmpB [Patescibacteria group bacterium]|nr:SsrA-binding protein SmpB [Patescibacteria group bacterium]